MKRQHKPVSGPFYTPAMQAWMHGYEPVIAQEMAANAKITQGVARSAMANTEMRAAGVKGGWGAGTIPGGLSNRSDPGKAGMIRKPSQLEGRKA